MQRDRGKARHGKGRRDGRRLAVELEEREDNGPEQQRHERERKHHQHAADEHSHAQERIAQLQHLLAALSLADGLADHDGRRRAETEADDEKQAVEVAHHGVRGEKLDGDRRIAEYNGQHAVAETPRRLIEDDGRGVFDEPAQHVPARAAECGEVKRDGPAAQRADGADEELRDAGAERRDGRALDPEHGKARLAEDQQVVQPRVQERRHAEELHAEGGVFHAALRADVDGREHVEHIGKADHAQIRRAENGQLVLV